VHTGDRGSRRAARSIRWRDRDHTRGSLALSLLVLSLPPIGTSLAGAVVFQLFDLKFISYLGTAAMAGVIVANQSVRQVSFLLVMGLSFGAQAMISRAVGASRIEEAQRIAGQVLLIGAVLAGLLALVGGVFPREILGLVDPAPDVLEAGVPYVRLTFIFSFGFIGVSIVSGILTGAGDTTTPMVIAIVASAISIVGEWCLVFGNLGAPALGVSGVALGIAVGQLCAMAMALWALFRGRCRVRVALRDLSVHLPTARSLLHLSWQPALQLLSRTLLIFYFIWLTSRFGTDVQAAFAMGLRLEIIPLALAFPIANACATLVGQNLGAGERVRARHSVGVALGAHAAVLWSASATMLLFRYEIVRFFSDDPQVIRFGAEYLLFSAASFALYGIYFVLFRALQGAGDMTATMLISLGSAIGLAAPLGYWLATQTSLGPRGIWTAGVVHAAAVTLLTAGWFLRGRWLRAGSLSPG
jgi:putative MATE family efflux protein